MSAAWAAVGVRSAAMRRRRVGLPAIRELAASPSLEAALGTLASGPYGHDVQAGQSLALAQRAVVASYVWNMRVLAGWAPRQGAVLLRALAAPIELINIDGRLQKVAGAEAPPPYWLGALATAWARLAATTDRAGLRKGLARSPWGDPGSDDPHTIALALRLSLTQRISVEVPAARFWAAGAAALFLARERAFRPGPMSPRVRFLASRVVGPAAAEASSLSELRDRLPAAARWALADVEAGDGLWLAEARWWARVDHDAAALANHGGSESQALVGTAAMLAVDAWRVRAALELAARGGSPVEEFNAVA